MDIFGLNGICIASFDTHHLGNVPKTCIIPSFAGCVVHAFITFLLRILACSTKVCGHNNILFCSRGTFFF